MSSESCRPPTLSQAPFSHPVMAPRSSASCTGLGRKGEEEHHNCAPIRDLFTESQNHRIVGVGRDLCGSPSPTPCPSRVTQSRLHSTTLRWVLNISREGDSTTSLGSLGQGSVTLTVKKQELTAHQLCCCFATLSQDLAILTHFAYPQHALLTKKKSH